MKIIKQPYSAKDLSCSQHAELEYFQSRIAQILRSAAVYGVVVTVDNPPNTPLAMGNYDLVVSVRPLRNYTGR